MAVSQGGDPGKPPIALLQFKAAVGSLGSITGPYNGYLYYWKSTRIDDLVAIASRLWPFLGPEKRDQFAMATRLSGKTLSLDPHAPWVTTETTERAWAAGFFDGEGTISVSGRAGFRQSYRQPSMEIPQSNANGVPATLRRFQKTAGCGTITGPHPPRNPWGRLPGYRWQLGGHLKVEAVASVLWLWLGAEKRTQIEWALSLVHTGLARKPHASAADRDA